MGKNQVEIFGGMRLQEIQKNEETQGKFEKF